MELPMFIRRLCILGSAFVVCFPWFCWQCHWKRPETCYVDCAGLGLTNIQHCLTIIASWMLGLKSHLAIRFDFNIFEIIITSFPPHPFSLSLLFQIHGVFFPLIAANLQKRREVKSSYLLFWDGNLKYRSYTKSFFLKIMLIKPIPWLHVFPCFNRKTQERRTVTVSNGSFSSGIVTSRHLWALVLKGSPLYLTISTVGSIGQMEHG